MISKYIESTYSYTCIYDMYFALGFISLSIFYRYSFAVYYFLQLILYYFYAIIIIYLFYAVYRNNDYLLDQIYYLIIILNKITKINILFKQMNPIKIIYCKITINIKNKNTWLKNYGREGSSFIFKFHRWNNLAWSKEVYNNL